jgi:hypothetical protein
MHAAYSMCILQIKRENFAIRSECSTLSIKSYTKKNLCKLKRNPFPPKEKKQKFQQPLYEYGFIYVL